MTYLDEAYRRFKLPISVIPFVGFDGTFNFAVRVNRGPFRFYGRPDTARKAYLAAVKELSQ